MKLSPFLFLAVLCFFILPVNAVTWDGLSQLYTVGSFVPTSDFSGNADEFFLAVNGTDIVLVDQYLGGGSVLINGFPSNIAHATCDGNYMYVVLRNGIAYKLEQYNSYKEFSSYSFSGNNRNAYILGDFSTQTSYALQIEYDNERNIYVSDPYGDVLYKIDNSQLTSTTYYSNMQAQSGSPIPMFAGSNLFVLEENPNDEVYLSTLNSVNTINRGMLLIDGLASTIRPLSISELSNGNIIICAVKDTTGADTLYLNEYNNTALIGTISSKVVTFSVTDDIISSIVLPSGVVVVSYASSNTLETFTSISEAGIYTKSELATTPPEITYNAKSVNAEYETYYNQTNVNFQWSLAIDDEFIDTYNSVYSEPIYNRYYWRIELFSPDNIFINSYIIPTNWKYQTYTLGIFGSGDYVNSGSVQFNNIVGNGTYTVKIYELNRITGAKAFLDSDTFEILAQTNPATTGGVSETSGESAAYNFLNSPYLVAIIIIGVVGFQFGRGRDGNINGSAMIVLIPLAVGLCALMGILPTWILYVMVLCIIAFVAVKMSTGGS